jgi:hypothetical protein
LESRAARQDEIAQDRRTGIFVSDLLDETSKMFVFFSNRMGCFGSLLVSALVTVALLFVFGVLRF